MISRTTLTTAMRFNIYIRFDGYPGQDGFWYNCSFYSGDKSWPMPVGMQEFFEDMILDKIKEVTYERTIA